MAANIQQAQANWERKTAQVGDRWKRAVSTAGPARYCEGLAKFGINPGACQQGPGARWAAGVQQVSAQDFQAAIAGKGARWAQRFVEGLSA